MIKVSTPVTPSDEWGPRFSICKMGVIDICLLVGYLNIKDDFGKCLVLGIILKLLFLRYCSDTYRGFLFASSVWLTGTYRSGPSSMLMTLSIVYSACYLAMWQACAGHHSRD